jgi:hypothetical protein
MPTTVGSGTVTGQWTDRCSWAPHGVDFHTATSTVSAAASPGLSGTVAHLGPSAPASRAGPLKNSIALRASSWWIRRRGPFGEAPEHLLHRLAPAVRRELADAEVRRQHRAAEEALRDSESRYRLLAEHAQDVI